MGHGKDQEDELLEALRMQPDALIRFGHFASPSVAQRIVLEAFDRRSHKDQPVWHKHGPAIAQLMGSRVLESPQWPRVAETALSEIVRDQQTVGDIRGSAHDILVLLWQQGTDVVREKLSGWFVSVAKAGDARLACRFFEYVPHDSERETFEPLRRRLVPWLVENAGAELVRGDKPFILLELISLCRAHYPDRLRGVLRILELCDEPEGVFSFDSKETSDLYPAIEEALRRGLPSEWVGHVLGGVRAIRVAWGKERFLGPVDPSHGMPLLGHALLVAIARGRLGRLSMDHWQWLLRFEPPAALEFDDYGLASCFQALGWSRHERPKPAALDAWCEVIAAAWFRRFGLVRPERSMVPSTWTLDVFAAEPLLAPGIAKAMRQALAASEAEHPNLETARLVMERSTSEPRVASAALLLLAPEAPSANRSPHATIQEIQAHLTSILRTEWSSVAPGVDREAMFRGAVEVRIVESDQVDEGVLVDFREATILTAEPYEYRRLATVARSREEALAMCGLYFIHEAIHVLQGVQHKSTITSLRATANESKLARLDLEADDLAARIYSEATGAPLAELKDLEGRTARHYPASLYHTDASVSRKSARLLGLRLDWLLRTEGHFGVSPNKAGFATALVPFANGDVLLLWNGPGYTGVLAAVPVHAGTSEELMTVARTDADVEELDDRLRALLPSVM